MLSDTASLLQQILSRATGLPGLELSALYPVDGGSINATFWMLTKDNRQWFCKINDNGPFPDLFEKERWGLDLLRIQEIFRIPAAAACETVGSTQILTLEWIDQGPKTLPPQPGLLDQLD